MDNDFSFNVPQTQKEWDENAKREKLMIIKKGIQNIIICTLHCYCSLLYFLSNLPFRKMEKMERLISMKYKSLCIEYNHKLDYFNHKQILLNMYFSFFKVLFYRVNSIIQK